MLTVIEIHRKALPLILEVKHRQRQIVQIVRALGAAGRFPRRLDRRQQQGNQDADDRDDYQQFDERKCPLGVEIELSMTEGTRMETIARRPSVES